MHDTTRIADYRELVLDMYALDIADLEARVIDLAAERDQYRELLSVALEQLQSLTEQNRRLRICLHRDLEQRYGPAFNQHKAAA